MAEQSRTARASKWPVPPDVTCQSKYVVTHVPRGMEWPSAVSSTVFGDDHAFQLAAP
jgi:hypothetical protein